MPVGASALHAAALADPQTAAGPPMEGGVWCARASIDVTRAIHSGLLSLAALRNCVRSGAWKTAQCPKCISCIPAISASRQRTYLRSTAPAAVSRAGTRDTLSCDLGPCQLRASERDTANRQRGQQHVRRARERAELEHAAALNALHQGAPWHP